MTPQYLLLSISPDGGSGEAVKPEMEKPTRFPFLGYTERMVQNHNWKEWNEHLASLPRIPVDLTNSGLKVGERFNGVEQKQSWGIVNATDEQHWKNIDDSEYRVCPPDRRRLILIPDQPGKGEVVKDRDYKKQLVSIYGMIMELFEKDGYAESTLDKLYSEAATKLSALNEDSLPSQEAPEQMKELAVDFMWECASIFRPQDGYQTVRKVFDSWVKDNKYYSHLFNPNGTTK